VSYIGNWIIYERKTKKEKKEEFKMNTFFLIAIDFALGFFIGRYFEILKEAVDKMKAKGVVK
jgi:hypothetical protein